MKKYFSDKYLELYYYIFFTIMVINQFLPQDVPEILSLILGIIGFIFILPKILLTNIQKEKL